MLTRIAVCRPYALDLNNIYCWKLWTEQVLSHWICIFLKHTCTLHLQPTFWQLKKERAPLLWAEILNFWWHSRILKVEIRKRRFPRFPFLWYVNTIIFALSLCVLSNSAKWSTLSRAIISWLTQHLAIPLLRMLSAFTPKFKQAANLAFIYS